MEEALLQHSSLKTTATRFTVLALLCYSIGSKY
jgi:hypothetical protein